MEDGGERVGQDILCEIDWENFLKSTPYSIDLFADDPSLLPEPTIGEPPQETTNPSLNSDPSWFGDVEHFLLQDDNAIEENRDFSVDFFSDILPYASEARSAEVRFSDCEIPSPELNSVEENEEKEKSDASEEDKNGDEDVQKSKKRTRQMRNRDSAMKSRERKKLYVRDLEMKSKYLEGECRRLEYAFSCCVMENQILYQRLQKDKASDVSSQPKQESAVLSLESLLLGSLFWLVSIACLFLLLSVPLVKKSMVAIGNAGSLRRSNGQESVEVRKAVNEVLRLELDFMKRRCKAMRTKTKVILLIA